MSPNAVFRATMDAITNETPMQATTVVQTRARCEPDPAAQSVP